jgi:hypothetical protein
MQRDLVGQKLYDEALELGLDDIRSLPNASRHEPAIKQVLDSLPRKVDGTIDWDALPKKPK